MSHVYTCVTESKQETQQITDCCILMQGKNNVGESNDETRSKL